MHTLKHWVVCLDLTDMDDFLVQYVNFLAQTFQPAKITIIHVIERTYDYGEMKELFPDLEDPGEVESLIRSEIQEKLHSLDQAGSNLSLVIETGNATDTIIRVLRKLDPDLLIMGNKSGYEGEGLISKKVVRYVPCSVLFVPETSRHELEKILIPYNFNEQSARAIQFGADLSDNVEADVTAQHIYQYPPRFFPGIPADDFKEKMQEPLAERLESFKKKYSIVRDIRFIFTLNQNSSIPEKVYDQALREGADMIIAGAKYQHLLTSVLMGEMPEKLIHYTFGIPLLIVKEKKSR